MKKSVCSLVFIFTILFSCSIIAQQVGTSIDNSKINVQGNNAINYEQKAEKVFNLIPASLDSKAQGIVEGTIYNVIITKKYYPTANYTEIIDKLNEIAVENPDPSIRVKALLASIYLSKSDIINIVPNFSTFDHEYIYNQIMEQLNNNVLAQK